jgi:hypothetical protein
MANGCQEKDVKKGRADRSARPERGPPTKAFSIVAVLEAGIYLFPSFACAWAARGKSVRRKARTTIKNRTSYRPPFDACFRSIGDADVRWLPRLAASLSWGGRLANDKDSCGRSNEIVDFRRRMPPNRRGIRESGSKSDGDAAK